MRILLVSNTYPPADISGVGTLVEELAAALEREGHSARVLTRRAPAGDARVIGLGGPKILWPLRAGWWFLRHRWRLSERLSEREPSFDLVHVHESDGVFVALAARLRRRRPRLLATLQVSYVEERRAVKPLRADGRILSRPTVGERLFAWGRAPLLAALGRLTARLADRVIAPSRATARELARDYGLAPERVSVIPNGIECGRPETRTGTAPRLPSGTPSENLGQPPDREPVIVFVGRLRTRKAVTVLVEAFRGGFDDRPAARLEIIGAGEQRAALERQVAALAPALRERVAFTGPLDRAEIARRLERAAVFCLPSTYEGFPLAILEAMAAGLPVVSTRVAGIPEAVEDGVSGLLVDPADSAGLATALRRLFDDPSLARRMGNEGRRRILRDFAIGSIARAHLDLYRTLA